MFAFGTERNKALPDILETDFFQNNQPIYFPFCFLFLEVCLNWEVPVDAD